MKINFKSLDVFTNSFNVYQEVFCKTSKRISYNMFGICENPCWKHNSLEGFRKIMCREYNHSIMLYFSNAVTGRHGKLSTETLTHYHAIHKMLWTCLSHDLRQVLIKDQ